MATLMATLQTDLEKYLKLWDLFYKEVKTSKKIHPNTLAGYAIYHEEHSESSVGNDRKTVRKRLEKAFERKDRLIRVRKNSILQIEECYKLLKEDYFVQELLDDEGPEHWFD